MPLLINNYGVIVDDWVYLDDEQALNRHRRVILSPARLLREITQLTKAQLAIGVKLDAAAAVEEIIPLLDLVEVVVLEFTNFTDGRAFSQARLLRQRYGFEGNIRAHGDVLRDQLDFMKRCGFDQFQIAETEDPDLAVHAFSDISSPYQSNLNQSAGR